MSLMSRISRATTPDPCPWRRPPAFHRTRLVPIALPATLLALLALCPPAAAAAVEDAEDPPAAEVEPRLVIHGFLTQAYALSDGNQVLGIPEEGTSDYRTAALQLRYATSARGTFALQISHERLGESPLARFREDVDIDWAFYQHELSDTTEVKVGRVPVPLGIYNEILDAGTVLPFYRPPVAFTSELAFSSEIVDGGVFSHVFASGSDWPLEVDLYTGGWDSVENYQGLIGVADAEDAVGLQAWVRTPLPGLRLGLAGQAFRLEGGPLRPPGVHDRVRLGQLSVDGVFSRFTARAEYRAVAYRSSDGLNEADVDAYYVETGLRLTRRLGLNLQLAWVDLRVVNPFGALDFQLERDRVVGLRYGLTSELVAKIEVHWNRGFMQVEEPVPPLGAPPFETTYGILSLSASF